MTRLPSSLVLVLPLALVSLGCGEPVPIDGLGCERDNECATGRCEEGRCVVHERDGGGAPLDDGGASGDSGGPGDAGGSDAGLDVGADGGAPDAGTDGGEADGGETDGGAPLDGGGPGGDAGAPDAGDGGAPGTDAGAPCGCGPTLARAPIEVCGDGYDNDCDGSVDEQPCGFLRTIVVDNVSNTPLPSGYSLAIPVSGLFHDEADTDELSARADVRVWRQTGAGFEELHRVLDPGESWAAPATLWFALAASVPGGGEEATGAYRLTWGAVPDDVTGPPRADEDQVFHFADFFDGNNAPGPATWAIEEDVGDGHDWNIRDGALILDSVDNDENGFPVATRDFAPLSGRFVVDLGFHWSGKDDDNDYAWRFLVGDASMESPPSNQDVDTDGVGPNLIWGYGNGEFGLSAQQSLAVDRQASGDPAILATGVTQPTRVRLVGDTGNSSFRVFVNDEEHANHGFLDELPHLSRVRFYPSEMQTERSGDQQFPHRRFEHVIVRPAVSPEPGVGLRDPPTCE